jgi:hypothetical protein
MFAEKKKLHTKDRKDLIGSALFDQSVKQNNSLVLEETKEVSI